MIDFIKSKQGKICKAMEFMQDNAAVHTAAVARNYLSDEAIHTIA